MSGSLLLQEGGKRMATDKVKKILDDLQEGVKDFFTSDKYINYLNVMSRFHSYSLNNQLLIAMQNPDATHIAGYNSWINNFDRHVKQGEKAITILAPMKRKVEVETGKYDKNGEPIKEEKEYISFRPVSVFDVSQTEGKELPMIATTLEGSVENYNNIMAALKIVSPFPFEYKEIHGSAKGLCNYATKTIIIKEGMSESQSLKTAIHETAHARLHENSNLDRRQKEIEAESVAYVVCNHFGLDTSDYSFGYVATWAGEKETDKLKASLETIKKESFNIINTVEKVLEERTREVNGIKPSEIESYANEIVKEAIADLGYNSETIAARLYGVSRTSGENIKAKVMVEYDGPDREDTLFNCIHEKQVSLCGVSLDINPIKSSKSGSIEEYYSEVKYYESHEMQDDSWPMITITYSSLHEIPVGSINIYEAKKRFDEAEVKLLKDNIKGNFAKINIKYTYEGNKHEVTDTVILGEGRKNFIDYLNLPTNIMTYFHRHVQILETVERARNEEAISLGSRRSSAQNRYEDMMYEWAEEQRKELNYNTKPYINKPPSFSPLVEQHKDWEVVR